MSTKACLKTVGRRSTSIMIFNGIMDADVYVRVLHEALLPSA